MPASANFLAASIAIRQHAPYVTSVTSSPFADDFRHAQWNRVLADVIGQLFLHAVTVQHLDHDGGFVGLQ
jgi:hypothetical protein